MSFCDGAVIGISTVSVEPSGYDTAAVIYNEPSALFITWLFGVNVKSGVSLYTFTAPLSAVNVNEFLMLFNSSSVNVELVFLISRVICGVVTVGVYFVACVNAASFTIVLLFGEVSLVPGEPCNRFPAASSASAQIYAILSPSVHNRL